MASVWPAIAALGVVACTGAFIRGTPRDDKAADSKAVQAQKASAVLQATQAIAAVPSGPDAVRKLAELDAKLDKTVWDLISGGATLTGDLQTAVETAMQARVRLLDASALATQLTNDTEHLKQYIGAAKTRPEIAAAVTKYIAHIKARYKSVSISSSLAPRWDALSALVVKPAVAQKVGFSSVLPSVTDDQVREWLTLATQRARQFNQRSRGTRAQHAKEARETLRKLADAEGLVPSSSMADFAEAKRLFKQMSQAA